MTFPIIPARTASSASYQISRSLRFRSSASAYLSRTPASAGNRQKWTWSGWVKLGAVSSWGTLFGTGGTTDSTRLIAQLNTAGTLQIDAYTVNLRVSNAVFRDPSAWYHIVVVFDSTNATAANRLRAYSNNVELTWATSNTVALNTDYGINNTTAHAISYDITNNGRYFDGYLAEVNFIDGQSLTPSSFGAFDTNGVWQPKAYTGTYGTNGFYLPFSASATSSFAGTFGGTQYLTTATNAGLGLGISDFTIEYWMNTTVAANGATLCCAGTGTVSYDGLFGYISGGALVTYLSSTGGSWDIASGRTAIASITTGRWYHIAYTRSGSTWRVFVDGTQVDTFTSTASLYQSGNQFTLARGQGTGIFTGLLSNVRVIKGTALYTSNFTPSTQPLTAVTNTQLLTLQNATIVDNSANSLTITNTGSVTTSAATPWMNFVAGQDSSGAGNNWFSLNVNVTSSGTTYDSMIDSPTNYADGGNGRGNYAVLNPINGNSGTFSAANLQFVGPTNWSCVPSTILIPSTGKWFVAATFTGSASGNTSGGEYAYLGVAPPTVSKTAAYNSALGLWIGDTGWVYNFSATGSNSGSSFSVNNEVLFAVDRDANTYVIYKNGSSVATGTIGTTSGADLMFVYGSYSSSFGQMALNFGQRPLANAAPSGFSALNTQNLPTPTIANGAAHMAATTFSGVTGGTQTISNAVNGVSFQPDLIWTKLRSGVDNNYLVDTVRGVSNYLSSSLTNAEAANSNFITGITSSGYSYGSSGYSSGTTVVGWQWNAGGSTVSNTAGSITSQVRANPTAGFSVVTWTSATGNNTVGHGLGVTPSLVIAKNRSLVADWPVYHTSVGGGSVLLLDTTAAAAANTTWFNGTAPTSSYFSTSTGFGSGNFCVAYCFAPVAGYSAFGSLTGNGSADGVFVYLGFKPKFVMWKASSTTGDWQIWDAARDTYNVVGNMLAADLSNAEATGQSAIDILSNGFKCRSATVGNNSGVTYVYAAFAEAPFKYSRAR